MRHWDSAMRRALTLWYDYPDEFRKLILNGMRHDYSWNNPGRHYVDIYDYVRHK
jgi:starch synthase